MAGQSLEQPQQLDVVGLLIVEAVAAGRGAGVQQVRRIAVDELTALEVVLGEKPLSAAVDLLHRVMAVKALERPRIEINANVV